MGLLQDPKPLKDVPRFCDLAEGEMREVCRAGREVTVPDGWSLIWEKTPADKAYLILEGSAAVQQGGTTIAELGPGDLVGEMALRDRKLRTATVSATTPLRLLHLTGEAFGDLYQRVPSFRNAVDAAVAERTAAYQPPDQG
ncbi:MAG: cyclic nucleotide-binding domain-containing protein [Micromonosporaceae bacterium]